MLLDEESRTLSLLTKQNALSPVAAIALTVVMGICLALANPLLLRLGVAHGGWLELALGVALCAAVGCARGRWLAARTAAASTWYQRGDGHDR